MVTAQRPGEEPAGKLAQETVHGGDLRLRLLPSFPILAPLRLLFSSSCSLVIIYCTKVSICLVIIYLKKICCPYHWPGLRDGAI